MGGLVKSSIGIFVGFVSILLIGCANRVDAPYEPRPKSTTEWRILPAAGEINTVKVGETMYRGMYRTSLQHLTASTEKVARGTGESLALYVPAHTSGPLLKTPDKGLNSLCVPGAFKNTSFAGDVCLVDQAGSGVFDTATQMGYDRTFTLNNPIPYKVETVVKTTDGMPAVQNAVLYQGTSKGAIHISFREFSNDLARPAFTQDIAYDLSKDGTAVIGFKGLTINVVKATPTDITYTIVQDFLRVPPPASERN